MVLLFLLSNSIAVQECSSRFKFIRTPGNQLPQKSGEYISILGTQLGNIFLRIIKTRWYRNGNHL